MALKVINLYAGPSSGKSTTAAGLFAKMKIAGYEVELVTEYAKDLVYENRLNILEQQEYILAKQNHKLHKLRNKVEYAITDSPLLLSTIYCDQSWAPAYTFEQFVYELYATYDNTHFFLERPISFQSSGRLHDLEQSKMIDNRVIDMLTHYKRKTGIGYTSIPTNENTVDTLFQLITQK